MLVYQRDEPSREKEERALNEELADLLPLFLTEARCRLDRLAGALDGAGLDGEARRLVARELHTLKGEARLLGMQPLAECCREAEEALERLDAGSASSDGPGRLRGLVADIGRRIAALGGTGEPLA